MGNNDKEYVSAKADAVIRNTRRLTVQSTAEPLREKEHNQLESTEYNNKIRTEFNSSISAPGVILAVLMVLLFVLAVIRRKRKRYRQSSTDAMRSITEGTESTSIKETSEQIIYAHGIDADKNPDDELRIDNEEQISEEGIEERREARIAERREERFAARRAAHRKELEMIRAFNEKEHQLHIQEHEQYIKEIEQKAKGNAQACKGFYKNGYEYEAYVASILEKNGFTNVHVTKGSGDRGVDIICEDLYGQKCAVQCKMYTGSPVGFKAVQEVFTGKQLYHCDVAMVITNSYFSEQAKEGASQLQVKLLEHIY